MTAADALSAARGAGVRIAVKGNHLLLEAPSPPPPDVIELLSRHKAELLTLWSEAKLNPGQHPSELDVVRWLNAHPEPSSPGSCAWCGEVERANAVVLPFGVQQGSHTWLHAECWANWHKARRAVAMQAIDLIES